MTLIPTNVVTNSFLYLFFVVKTKNKNQIFRKLVVWLQKTFLFFVCSELRSTSEVCRVQQSFAKEFSYMSLLFIYSFIRKADVYVT